MVRPVEAKTNLRAGIIGSGFIGPVHAEALRRNGIEVLACCGSDSAIEMGKRLNIPHVFTGYDYRSMLAMDELDAIHITSPNRFHREMALATLASGKHCICEKPLAMNAKESAEILKAAEESDRIFAVNYNIRFYPAALHLRGLIQDGELGDIIHINGSYMQDWLLYDTDFNWRLLPEEGGNLRVVGDIGSHWMDLVTFVTGLSIESVYASLGRYHDTRKRPLGQVETFSGEAKADQNWEPYSVKTEDYGTVLLKYGNGALGNMSVSQVACGRNNCVRLEVYGSKQSAWWDSEDPERIVLGHRGQPNELYLRDPSYLHPSARHLTDYPGGHTEGFPDTFKMLYREIYRAIAEGGTGSYLFAGAKAGHEEMLVLDAIEASAREQAWVDL